jgi:AraC-like DNA-binding protein
MKKIHYNFYFRCLILCTFFIFSNGKILGQNFTSSGDPEKEKLIKLYNKVQSISNDQPDKALEVCFQIEKESKNNFPEILSHTYVSMGQIYSQMGNHEEAIYYGKKAKEGFHHLNMNEYEADVLRLLSNEYNALGLNDEAVKKINEAISIAKNDKNHKFYNESLGNLYSVKASLFDISDSITKYDRLSLHYFKEIKLTPENSRYLAQAYINLASDYLSEEERPQLQKPDSSLILLDKAMNVNDSYGKEERINAYIIFNKAKAYYYKKEYDKAEKEYLLGLSSAKRLKETYLIKDSFLRLKELYQAIGDKDNQLVYQERYNKINDSLISAQKHSLNKEVKDLQDTQQKSFSKTKKSLFYIITLIVILLLISIFIGIKNHKKSKREYTNYQKIIEKLQNKESLIASVPVSKVNNTTTEKTTFSVPSDKEAEILEKLNDFEKTEGFKNKNLSLSSLAESFSTNTAYISTVININKSKNFNNYINELRVNYIINKLKNDPQYLKYKISHLAEECGFSSHNTFTTAFSNFIGVSPSNFIKFLSKETQSVSEK